MTLAELAGEPLVLLDLPHSREYFRSLFAAEGVEPTVGHRSEHPEVIRTMVANGYGYTLINARPVIDQALDGRRVARSAWPVSRGRWCWASRASPPDGRPGW